MRTLPIAKFLSALIAAQVFTAPATLEAQDATLFHGALDAGVLMRSNALDTRTPTARIAPELAIDNRWLRAVATSDMTGADLGWRVDRAALNATLSPAPFGPFRLTTAAHSERFAGTDAKSSHSFGAQTTVSVVRGTLGAWSGASIERDSSFSGNAFLLGAWKQFGNTVVSVASVTRGMRIAGKGPTLSRVIVGRDSVFNDTLGTYTYFDRLATRGDSGTADRTRLWSELQAHLSYMRGPLLIEGIVGARPAVDQYARALWGRVRTTMSLTPRVALIASAGNDVSRITLGAPPTRVITLGVRFSAILPQSDAPAPVRVMASAFSLRAAGDSSVVVSIAVPGARTVELAGDFDAWSPVSLGQVRAGIWEVTLRLRPGTYRMNVRVDGDAWRAPPGVATTADEFNGTVGLVVVR